MATNSYIQGTSKKMKTALVLSLSILIFVLCAGVVIVKISQHIHEDAEKSLKREEVIAAARNKQILGGIEIIENFEKQRVKRVV